MSSLISSLHTAQSLALQLLQISVYLYKLRVVLNASDDKVAGSAWADLATALYCLSRAMLLPSSQTFLSPPDSSSVVDYANAQSVQARLQAIGSVKQALRHEPGRKPTGCSSAT